MYLPRHVPWLFIDVVHMPSKLWMLHKSEKNAGKATFHPLFYEHSVLSKRTVRGERNRGDKWVLFCHVYRGAETRNRRKNSKQVNCCFCFKNKYLGSYLWGSGLGVLKEWGEIPKSQDAVPEAIWDKAECPDLKALMTFVGFPLCVGFFLKLLPAYLMHCLVNWS